MLGDGRGLVEEEGGPRCGPRGDSTAPGGAGRAPVLNGQAVYDTELGITWLADANAAAGSPFDDGDSSTDGRMTWANAKAWADSLTVGGVTEWRLPAFVHPDPTCSNYPPSSSGSSCSGSELGHLYYVTLGASVNAGFGSATNPDYALFSNVEAAHYFYTKDNDPVFPSLVVAFDAITGSQGSITDFGNQSAWAVHDGAVGLPPVSGLPAGGLAALAAAMLATGYRALRRQIAP